MYDDFDDDAFLGPEALVSLHFERDDCDLGRSEAMESVECNPRARLFHAHDLHGWEEDPLNDLEDEDEHQMRSTPGRLWVLS